MANASDLFARQPDTATVDPSQGRWRVLDARVLRRAIAVEASRLSAAPQAEDVGRSDGLAARLRMAEETLIDCAEEPSAPGRRIMAESAMNYLRQFMADVLPERRPWWDIDPDVVDAIPGNVETGLGTVTRARVRADLALARLTASTAAGVQVDDEFLLAAAGDLTEPFGSSDVDQEWLRRLSARFAELTLSVIRPSVADNGQARESIAPARLLSALTWRRALADAPGDVREAVRWLADCLRRAVIKRASVVPRGDPTYLFQVLDQLPYGRERINVYSTLLEILPRQLRYHEEEQVVPGVLVTAVTEPQTTNRLRIYAEAIEDDLAQSDYASGSALIGQTSYVVQCLAETGASMDHTVRERSDRARRGMLALAGVAV